jgi:hypothetical protein
MGDYYLLRQIAQGEGSSTMILCLVLNDQRCHLEISISGEVEMPETITRCSAEFHADHTRVGFPELPSLVRDMLVQPGGNGWMYLSNRSELVNAALQRLKVRIFDVADLVTS